jgi:phosphoribosylaminoimidazole carboxylase (NCAIR synthetase)
LVGVDVVEGDEGEVGSCNEFVEVPEEAAVVEEGVEEVANVAVVATRSIRHTTSFWRIVSTLRHSITLVDEVVDEVEVEEVVEEAVDAEAVEVEEFEEFAVSFTERIRRTASFWRSVFYTAFNIHVVI